MARGELELRTIRDQLASQIRKKIISGDYAPGMELRQDALAEEYHVSRTPIREALMQLASEGLIQIRPHRGVVVQEIEEEDIRDFYFIKGLLHVEMYKLICRTRVPLPEIPQMRQELMQAYEHWDIPALSEFQDKWERWLQSKCPSPRLAALVKNQRTRGFCRNGDDELRKKFVTDIYFDQLDVINALEQHDVEELNKIGGRNAHISCEYALARIQSARKSDNAKEV